MARTILQPVRSYWEFFRRAGATLRTHWLKAFFFMLFSVFIFGLAFSVFWNPFFHGKWFGGGFWTLVSPLLTVGFYRFFICLDRDQPAGAGSLFFGFRRIGTILGASLLIGLIVVIGFILFIIPGIVFGLNYAMTFCILADDKPMTALQAMRKSKEMMYGHRWQLIVLSAFLLFILLLFSSLMAAGLILFGILQMISLFVLFFILFFLGSMLFFYAFSGMLYVSFYHAIRPDDHNQPDDVPYRGMRIFPTVLLCLLTFLIGTAQRLGVDDSSGVTSVQQLRNAELARIRDVIQKESSTLHRYPTEAELTALFGQNWQTYDVTLLLSEQIVYLGDLIPEDAPGVAKNAPLLISYRKIGDKTLLLVFPSGGRMSQYEFSNGGPAAVVDCLEYDFQCTPAMLQRVREQLAGAADGGVPAVPPPSEQPEEKAQ